MGQLISDQKRQELQETIDTVRNMSRPTTSSNRRVIRGGGGGAGIYLLIITASTDKNTYTANVINNRTDKTVLKSAVTLKALDHTDGTFPNSIILTCSYDSANDFYEPTNYAVFYGS